MSAIKVVKELGARIIAMKDDGTPRQILKGYIKEGRSGKFISIEKHWVQTDLEEFTDSKWARWSISIPYDRDKAIALIENMKELVEEAFK